MSKKITRVLAVALFMLCSSVALNAGEHDDFGSWVSIQANKSFNKAYAFLRVEHRSNNKFGNTEAKFLSAGGGYKILPWLNTDLSYEYWRIGRDINCHKVVFSGTGTLKAGNLSASLREKLEFAMLPQSSTNSWTLRSRLRVQYNFENSCFRPYVMSEIFNWSNWQRSLYYVGTDIKATDFLSFDVFYLYHLPNGSVPVHTFGLGAYFNF